MDASKTPFIIISTSDWNSYNNKIECLQNSISILYSQANKTDFFTPSEAAKILKVSLKTLSNWRERGLISFFQVGSNVRFSKKQIEEFVEKNSLKIKY